MRVIRRWYPGYTQATFWRYWGVKHFSERIPRAYTDWTHGLYSKKWTLLWLKDLGCIQRVKSRRYISPTNVSSNHPGLYRVRTSVGLQQWHVVRREWGYNQVITRLCRGYVLVLLKPPTPDTTDASGMWKMCSCYRVTTLGGSAQTLNNFKNGPLPCFHSGYNKYGFVHVLEPNT